MAKQQRAATRDGSMGNTAHSPDTVDPSNYTVLAHLAAPLSPLADSDDEPVGRGPRAEA